MLCQIPTQLLLAGLEEKSAESLVHQPNSPPPVETGASVEDHLKFDKKAYMKRWRQEHPDRVREHERRSRKRNGWKENAKRRLPEYKPIQKRKNHEKYFRHKAEYAEKNRQWVLAHREQRIDIQRRYRERNKEMLRKQAINRYYANREVHQTQEWKDRHNGYVARRRITNPQYLIAERLRATMHQAIRRQFGQKARKTRELLGCSVAELKAHIERQFVNGMSWEDRSSFVIDHYVPCAAFDLTQEEEQRWAFNWRNLRPISRHENSIKSDTIPDPLPDWLPAEIRQRILSRKSQ